MSNEVANTVLAQLGSRALIMLGGHRFVALPDGLQFSVKGSKKPNRIVIKLDAGTDTYTVSFWICKGTKATKVAELDDVYVDSLHAVIESETGLRTSL